jgi:hypothetical protein
MQLTWHINKHGCNIYAWVQLSKWKVENTMLEHLFVLHREIKECHNLLLYVIMQDLSKRPMWQHVNFCSQTDSTISKQVQNIMHYSFKTMNLFSHELHVEVSSFLSLFYITNGVLEENKNLTEPTYIKVNKLSGTSGFQRVCCGTLVCCKFH